MTVLDSKEINAKLEILINETDYASCDDGSSIELLYMDHDTTDIAGRDFDGLGFSGWEWSGNPVNGNATALITSEAVPKDCTDEEHEAHSRKVLDKAKTDIEALGYRTDWY